jgi:2-polyprenyl-3-methyl-5-hydroxy-6-metoxy-1,4-benzoquinol methylase
MAGYSYDPQYCPDTKCHHQQYDFIVCTEAIEHFHNPHHEWNLWLLMLKDHGVIGIMTKRVENLSRFKDWHYKNDQTHVSFLVNLPFVG